MRLFFYMVISMSTKETSHEIVNTMKHDRLAGSRKRQICPVIKSTRGGEYFEIDLSWVSGVRSDIPPHLKVKLKVSSTYGTIVLLM